MIDYASLAALAAVVREGGFDRAAAFLGVTPSAVSQRVRSLEERLGAVLVVRGQPPRPTEVGARLCAHAEKVRLLEGELAAGLPGLAGMETGPATFRVAVNADSLGTWFLTAAAAFHAKTSATLDIVLAREEHTAEKLRSGEVLAAVTADPVGVQGCRTLALGRLRYRATATPAFAARWFATGVDRHALARAPVLRFDREDHLQARWARENFDADIAGAPTTWLPATQAFVDANTLGLGWALNPTALVEPLIASGALIEIAPRKPFDVALFWQHARLGARLLASLTEEVRLVARAALR